VWACDELFFLARDLENASSMDLAGFRTAVESLGSAFRPASTFGSLFGPGRLHDGAHQYRLNAYSTACRCFRYASPLMTAR
jgi:hypothetical protein